MSDQNEPTKTVPELGSDALLSPEWKGELSRADAIRILDKASDQEDPNWEFAVGDFYDEETDTMPTFRQVLEALGVTKEEGKAALGIS